LGIASGQAARSGVFIDPNGHVGTLLLRLSAQAKAHGGLRKRSAGGGFDWSGGDHGLSEEKDAQEHRFLK
jgi:hypothetical protein